MKSTARPASLSTPEPALILDDLGTSHLRVLGRVAFRCRGARGVCREKVAGLSEWLGVSDRQVRRIFARLEELGLVSKVDRRRRWSDRCVTEVGLAVLRAASDGAGSARSGSGSGQRSGQRSGHKGEAVEPGLLSPEAASPVGACGPCDPARYRPRRGARVLSEAGWAAVAGWLGSARSVSWARCKVAHRAFEGVILAVHRSREWSGFARSMAARGACVSAEDLVVRAVLDAVRCGRDFGTVETAVGYVAAVVRACVAERRLPGAGPVSSGHVCLRG